MWGPAWREKSGVVIFPDSPLCCVSFKNRSFRNPPGPGLWESLYEKYLLQEFTLRGIPVVTQERVSIK